MIRYFPSLHSLANLELWSANWANHFLRDFAVTRSFGASSPICYNLQGPLSSVRPLRNTLRIPNQTKLPLMLTTHLVNGKCISYSQVASSINLFRGYWDAVLDRKSRKSQGWESWQGLRSRIPQANYSVLLEAFCTSLLQLRQAAPPQAPIFLRYSLF